MEGSPSSLIIILSIENNNIIEEKKCLLRLRRGIGRVQITQWI